MPDEVTIDKISIEVSANTTDAEKNLARLERVVSNLEGLQRRANRATENVRRVTDSAEKVSHTGNFGAKTPKVSHVTARLAEKKTYFGEQPKLKESTQELEDVSNKLEQIKTKSDEASGSVSRLFKAIDSFSSSSKSAFNSIKNGLLTQTKSFFSPVYSDFRAMASEIRTMTKDWFRPISDRAKDFKSEFSGIVKDAFRPIKDEARNIKSDVSARYGDAFNNLKSIVSEKLSSAFWSAKNIASSFTSGLSSAFSSAKNIASSITSGLSSAFTSLRQSASSVFSKLGKAASTAASHVKKFGKSLLSIATIPFRKYVNAISSSFSNLVSTIQHKIALIKRIAMLKLFRLAFQGIIDGLKEANENLYRYSNGIDGTLAKSRDKIYSASQYASNSLAAMTAPLINALAPAIEYVIDRLVELMNMFNQFVASITGAKTWTKAVKQQLSYGDSLESTDKKAKKLKNTLMGFDELNVLNDNRDLSEELKNANAANMFEEVPVDSKIGNLAQKIKDMIAKGDWDGLGRFLADKLNSVFEKWDAYASGRKLGEKINNVIDFAYGFLDQAKFDLYGKRVAEFLNGAIEKINWEKAGRTLVLGFTSALDFLIAFINNLHMDSIGKAIGDFINGAVDEGVDWFQKHINKQSFLKIGEQIATLLNTAIGEIHWDELGNLLVYGITSVFDMLIGFIKKFDTSELGHAIGSFIGGAISIAVDWIESQDWKANFEMLVNKLGDLISGFFKGISDGLSTGKPSEFKKTLKDICDNLSRLGDLLKGDISFKEFFDDMSNATSIIVSVASAIGMFLALSKLVPAAIAIIAGISAAINPISVITVALSAMAGAITYAIINFDELSQEIKGDFSTIGSAFQEEVIAPMKRDVSEFFGKAKDTWDNAVGWIKNIPVKIREIKTNVKSTFTELWADMKSDFSSILVPLKNNFVNLFANAKNDVKSIVDSIRNHFVNTLTNVRNWFNSLQLRLPHIKLPHFILEGEFSLDPPSVPHLSVDWYAKGGFPNEGQLFVAREAGAEMVGSIGGRTAVANNQDIVNAVSKGVYSAVKDAMGSSSEAPMTVNFVVDGEVFYKQIVRRNRNETYRTGTNPLMA